MHLLTSCEVRTEVVQSFHRAQASCNKSHRVMIFYIVLTLAHPRQTATLAIDSLGRTCAVQGKLSSSFCLQETLHPFAFQVSAETG